METKPGSLLDLIPINPKTGQKARSPEDASRIRKEQKEGNESLVVERAKRGEMPDTGVTPTAPKRGTGRKIFPA